jgi:TRAP-type C4-dicarboxylate transport system substrate-binding protein
MAFGEVFSAMEQGVVDGQENPWSTILTSNFYEVQDYGSETRHVYTPFVIMIGEDYYNDMPEEYQTLIQEAAEDTRDYERTISREYDEWSKEQLEAQGMEVTEISDEQLAEFQDATQPVYDEFSSEIGEDIVQQVQDMVAEVEGQ